MVESIICDLLLAQRRKELLKRKIQEVRANPKIKHGLFTPQLFMPEEK